MLNAIEPDRTIVFVADTIGVDDGIEEYQGILKKAKGEIENLFGKEVLERLKIELVPSKGSFSTDQNSPYRYKFERSIRDYSVVSLLKIVKELLELIAEREGERRVPIELHLDMSRGINFMSPILLKNLELVGKALSYFTEVTLFSYNSDPFVSKIPPEAQRLNVNLVEREKLVPAVPQSRIERTSLTFTGEERRYLNGILGGFYFALPLLIATSCSRIEVDKLLAKAFEDGDSYWERVEFKIEKRLEKIREKEVEKEYRIYKFSPFEEDFEKVILSLFLGKITKLAFPDLQRSEEGIKENILRKIASSYPFLFAERELQTLKERIKKWENRLKEEEQEWVGDFEKELKNRILENYATLLLEGEQGEGELLDLYNRAFFQFRELSHRSFEKEREKWHLVGELFSDTPQQAVSNRRNFLAHGGFSREMVEFKKGKEGLFYRYTEKFIPDIIDNLANPTRQI